jgi:hypothetical protein
VFYPTHIYLFYIQCQQLKQKLRAEPRTPQGTRPPTPLLFCLKL